MGNAESRLGFRQAVFQLYETKEIAASDTAFWQRLFAGPGSIDELFGMIAPRDIRSVITRAPVNLKILVIKAVEIIVKATNEPGAALDRAAVEGLSNAVRLLVRVLPFVFEDRGYNWKQELFTQPIPGSASDKTLAEELVDRLYVLLFLPGFTLAPNVTKRKDGTFYIIWEVGIAAKVAPPSTVEIDTNRLEVLKLMLVLMSPVLYMTSNDLKSNGNWWTILLIQRANSTIVMALLASLLNVVCAYDPIGLGMPYNYYVFSDTREPLVETSLQTLLVLIDYCYPLTGESIPTTAATPMHEPVPRPAHETAAATGSAASEQTPQPPAPEHDGEPDQDLGAASPAPSAASALSTRAPGNIYQEYIARVHRKEDFQVLVAGLVRLLKSAVVSTQTYLPGSMKRVRFTNDLAYFVWKFLELNKRFFAHLLRDPALLDIVLSLLFFMSEARNDDGKVGVVHVIAFTMLILSGDRNFGVRLNKQYDQTFTALKLPAFEGNYADVLFLVLHQVIVDGHRSLLQLYDCILTVIANAAPYVKSVSSVTAHKLLSLLRMFTAPKFLLASPNNCELSLVLMDALNNMVQYQFDGNTRLIYAILRNQKLFEAIYNLDLQTAMSKLSVTSASESLDSTAAPAEAAESAPAAVPSPRAANAPAQLAVAQGGARWTPNEEWMYHYKNRLPLLAIMRLLQVLVPQVEQVCREMNINSEQTVLDFLNSGTLVGLLPLPNPIMVRRYKPNVSTYVWATVNLWGSIYLANLEPPIWYGTQVALFILRTVE
eukprot:Unigene7058_Nuclearia_a/m.21624 Unigene7058_Nuclearia_a/g.21624  ORF Unigene7058_Nuclearia_a/g.21624 Unigene7058_Nuclearia_a/m.21624 type:complete len:771 (+) Unigene7058_Nuclearia_a:142-2454(+)